jgi:hypothetical protein
VNVIGSGFTGATAVRFGGVPAASFVVNGDNSITATTPAAVAAGVVDVSVTNSLGVSALTPADRFTYLASSTVTTACPTGGCIAVFPTAPGVSVSVSASTGCATCNVVGGIEPLGPQSLKCPGGAAPELQSAAWVQATQNGGAFSKIVASVSYMQTSNQAIEDGNLAWFNLVSVCYVNGVPTPVSPLAAGARSAAVAATAAPKAVSLKPCSKTKDQPPCLVGKTVTEGVAHVVVQLPGEGATFRIVTPEVKVKRLKPALASRGSLITISGKNMDAATGVVIGGVETPIIAGTRSKLQVMVPEDAGSGDVTVLTLSRPAVAPQSLIWQP